mmetsp:Transcript_4467/g.28439  ORF Transcript_4467/g.28439 Transcript_4467/m.28439 type:complete len:437 (-) Transcript_4467:1536-2846(-)
MPDLRPVPFFSWLEFDCCGDHFPVVGVRDPKHRRSAHNGMLFEDLFHLRGVHAFSAGSDDIFDASHDLELRPCGVEESTHVTALPPLGLQHGIPRGIRIVLVAQHDVWTTHQDFPCFTSAPCAWFYGQAAVLLAPDRPRVGDRFVAPVACAHADGGEGFRGAVRGGNRGVREHGACRSFPGRVQRSAADQHRLDVRHGASIDVSEVVQHRRDQGEVRHEVLFHGFAARARVETFQEDVHAAAGPQGRVQLRKCAHVRQWERVEDVRAHVQAHRATLLHRLVERRRVRHTRCFRLAARSRREAHERGAARRVRERGPTVACHADVARAAHLHVWRDLADAMHVGWRSVVEEDPSDRMGALRQGRSHVDALDEEDVRVDDLHGVGALLVAPTHVKRRSDASSRNDGVERLDESQAVVHVDGHARRVVLADRFGQAQRA